MKAYKIKVTVEELIETRRLVHEKAYNIISFDNEEASVLAINEFFEDEDFCLVCHDHIIDIKTTILNITNISGAI